MKSVVFILLYKRDRIVNIDILKSSAKASIHSSESFIKSLRSSQKIFKKTIVVYPPVLDDMIDEACRDIKCLIRRTEIFLNRLQKMEESGGININELSVKETIIKDLEIIKSINRQCIEKTGTIIMEKKSLQEINSTLLKDNEQCEIESDDTLDDDEDYYDDDDDDYYEEEEDYEDEECDYE